MNKLGELLIHPKYKSNKGKLLPIRLVLYHVRKIKLSWA